MFRYKASLGHVHDLIEIREGNERLPLRVDADPISIVRLIGRLEPQLSSIQDQEQAEKEAEGIAREICNAIFGKQQMKKIFEMYNDDSSAVLGICSKYIAERLGKLVTKKQKKARI
jgi:hypothetical protein